MQFTGPLFLFLFLPLALPLVLALPQKARAAAMAAVSALWYLLANYQNPVGLGVVFGTVLLAYLLTLPQKRALRKKAAQDAANQSGMDDTDLQTPAAGDTDTHAIEVSSAAITPDLREGAACISAATKNAACVPVTGGVGESDTATPEQGAPRTAAHGEKIRCVCAVLGVALPLIAWVLLRVLHEYAQLPFAYPAGYTFVALGAVSMALDVYFKKAAPPRYFVDAMGYLLFFPTLIIGPLIRYCQFETLVKVKLAFTPRTAYEGICLFMMGFIKRIAVAAVLLRTLEEMLQLGQGHLPFVTVFLLLALAYFLLYFFVAGAGDMARGLCSMFGVTLPRDRGDVCRCTEPFGLPLSLVLSLTQFVRVYLTDPLRRRVKGRRGEALAAALTWLCVVLFFRFHFSLLLYLLPWLIFELVRVVLGERYHPPRTRFGRCVGVALSVFACAVLSLCMMAENPLTLPHYFIFGGSLLENGYQMLYLFNAVNGARYFGTALILLVLYFPVKKGYMWLFAHSRERGKLWLKVASTAVVFSVFLFTLIYFMPQFPQYAIHAYQKISF